VSDPLELVEAANILTLELQDESEDLGQLVVHRVGTTLLSVNKETGGILLLRQYPDEQQASDALAYIVTGEAS
jgi:hypothetical protein